MAQHNWSHITTVLQDRKFQCKLLDCSEELGMMSIQGPLRSAVCSPACNLAVEGWREGCRDAGVEGGRGGEM